MNEIPNCFYRVSIKALILNETRDKFLITKEADGRWELPGGGLDWGATPEEDLKREIQEEMGLKVTYVAQNPSYFIAGQAKTGTWVVNVLFEAKVENLDFTPSDECIEIKFVDKSDTVGMDVFSNVKELVEKFDPMNHSK